MVLAEAMHGRLGSLRQLVKTKEVPVKGAPDTRHIRTAIEQYKLASRIYLEASVRSIRSITRAGWSVLGESGGGQQLATTFQTACEWAVLCTDRLSRKTAGAPNLARVGNVSRLVVLLCNPRKSEIRFSFFGDYNAK